MKRLLYLLLFLPLVSWGQNEAINIDSDTITYSGSLANSAIQVGKVYQVSGPNGDPSGLALTVASDDTITLSWSTTSTNAISTVIERSTDNVTFTKIDTVSGVTTYTSVGLTADTRYYYRVYEYLGSSKSDTTIDNDWTWTSQYATVYNNFTTKPSASVTIAQAAMVNHLVDSSVWSKLDALYIFNNNISANALINWIIPGTNNATVTHGTGGADPVFTAYQGYTMTAANKSYIATGYNPTTADTINFRINGASLGLYFRKLNQVSSQLQMGVDSPGGYLALGVNPRYNAEGIHSDARFYANVNVTGGAYTTSTTQDFTGLYSAVRYNATNVYQYRLDTPTDVGSNSVSKPNGVIDIGRNTDSYYTDGQFSMCYIGGLLTQSNITNLLIAYENYRDLIDCTISIMGNSTVGEHSSYFAISELMDNDNYAITDFSHTGENIAQQKARFVALSDNYLSHIKCVFVQVGLNDYTMTTEQILAAYQDLIDTIRDHIGSDGKIVGVTMIPCIRSGDQQWIDLNEAIRGNGDTPITGLDDYIDTVATALNNGSNGLAVAYDSGDALHENDAGRQIIADLYDAQLTEFGL